MEREPDRAGELDGRRIAILAADGVERVALEQPRRALDDAVARTTLLSIHDGEIAARDHDLDTSRLPDDLPALCERIVRESAGGTGR